MTNKSREDPRIRAVVDSPSVYTLHQEKKIKQIGAELISFSHRTIILKDQVDSFLRHRDIKGTSTTTSL